MNTSNRRVPLDQRKRTETSCDKCKSRKQKCDRLPGQDECRYCQRQGIVCATTQVRKKRIYGSVEGLGTRLSLLESLVKGLLPEADLSSVDEMRALGRSLGIPLPASEESGLDTTKNSNKQDEEITLPDQQGQDQYIGPASSFYFHLNLRGLFGPEATKGLSRFIMFGRNAADTKYEAYAVERRNTLEYGQDSSPESFVSPGRPPSHTYNSPSDGLPDIDQHALDSLVVAFFDHIHADFPVLHEASFREEYETWSLNPSGVDRAWLCSLLCVLILARRVAPHIHISEEQEEKWWCRVQALLPSVVFMTSMPAVQALMLSALHLHNNYHRDACWTLTGAAVRIAFAIGLHRDGVKAKQTPVNRELRKRLWWSLYGFEQIQVSSHDRPSAIENSACSVGCPRASILGMGEHSPPEHGMWSNRLVVILGQACRISKTCTSTTSDDTYLGPLSPAAGILRDLTRWKQSLPAHLTLESIDSSPPSFQRPLLLLHSQYHYTVSLISRSALFSRATILNENSTELLQSSLLSLSDTCIESGRTLAQLQKKLDALGKFNAVTWWDIYYNFSGALILVLDIICTVMQSGAAAASESRELLRQAADLALQHSQNPLMPGTIHKWATVVVEIGYMTEDF
ncbi:hypothetical protein BU16DRAFT_422600, partial [Lophium mytilinum]